MLTIFLSARQTTLKRISGFNHTLILRNKFSSKKEQSASHIHKISSEPLRYLNVGQQLSQAALKYGDQEAVVSCSENSRLTFGQALDKSDRLAAALLNLKLSKGDCVAIWANNFEFWYISFLAIARAGLICVALNPAYQLPELDYCIKKVNVKAIIAPESFRQQKHYEMLTSLVPNMKDASLGSVFNENNSLRNVIIHSDKKLPGAIQFTDLLRSSSEADIKAIENLQPSISPDLACNIQFSSGTTGQPKAAILSHFGLINNSYGIGIRQEFDKNYRRVCVNNPFFHVYGVVIAIMNSLNHGSTLVLPAPHFSPEDALKNIVKEKCDVIYGTPTMFVDLVSKQKQLNIELPEIEFANTGGAICTPKLVQDIESVLKVKKIRSCYGLTETTAVVFQSLPDDDNKKVQEYVGHLSDHLEAKIIDKDGNAVPFGVPGELCIRGYCTMLGYWQDEAKTKEILDNDKWFKTGDQFVLYSNGYGKVVGRLKEMIIRGGENLFPREIEDFMNTHPNILETHVIGIPDERMGEEVGAFIRLKDKTTALTHNDVKQYCKGKLAHFKIPRYVVVVDEFPRTISGKVQKFKFMKTFENEFKNIK